MKWTCLALLLAASCAAPEPVPGPMPAIWFTEIAKSSGLGGKPGGRCIFADFNGDGQVDVVLEKQRFYVNDRGTFHEATWLDHAPSVILFGDVDNDGDLDLFCGEYCDTKNKDYKDAGFRNSLWLNDGKGHFTKVESGLDKFPATTCAAVFFDYDRDGKLDLFVGNWYREYGTDNICYPCRLYRGRGDGTFEDVSEKSGIALKEVEGLRDSARPVYGATHADWNNDGWQDLLVCSYGRQWNVLWKNNGNGTFTDVGEATTFDGDADQSGKYPDETKQHPKLKDFKDEKPYRSNGNTFDAAVGDYNNDGNLDVFLAEITHWWAGPSSDRSSLLTNLGPEKGFAFRRDADAMARTHEGDHWNQGDLFATWLDYDNDGLLDLIISSGDYPDRQEMKLYRQREDHTFENVTKIAGIDWEGGAQLSIADLDGDGDLDILVGRSFFRLPAERTKDRIPEVGLFRNDVGNRSRWIEVTLEGVDANRGAIGARVVVGKQMREVRSSEGCGGHQNPATVHFGLGSAKSVDVTIIWPDKSLTKQMFNDVKSNRKYRLKQGGELE